MKVYLLLSCIFYALLHKLIFISRNNWSLIGRPFQSVQIILIHKTSPAFNASFDKFTWCLTQQQNSFLRTVLFIFLYYKGNWFSYLRLILSQCRTVEGKFKCWEQITLRWGNYYVHVHSQSVLVQISGLNRETSSLQSKLKQCQLFN